MKKVSAIDMLIVPCGQDPAEIVGFHEVPDRLERVYRLPNETLKEMTHRALWMVKGTGPLLVYPIIKPKA